MAAVVGEKRRSKPTPAELLAESRRQLEHHGPGFMVEPLEVWLERNPDAERPTIEEAEQIVRDLLADEDLSELSPVGKSNYGDRWLSLRETFGEQKAEKALQNWISASEHNLDCWNDLNSLSARLLRERQPLPDALQDWLADVCDSTRTRPKGKPGKPWYANENRDMWIGYAVTMLLHLGMNEKRNTYVSSKESACDAVANYLKTSQLTLSYGAVTYEAVVSIRSKLRKKSDRMPAPWEVWENPIKS